MHTRMEKRIVHTRASPANVHSHVHTTPNTHTHIYTHLYTYIRTETWDGDSNSASAQRMFWGVPLSATKHTRTYTFNRRRNENSINTRGSFNWIINSRNRLTGQCYETAPRMNDLWLMITRLATGGGRFRWEKGDSLMGVELAYGVFNLLLPCRKSKSGNEFWGGTTAQLPPLLSANVGLD